MFADVDADIYVLVDGDATYHAPSARAMIARLIEDRLDMVVAARVEQEQAAFRPGHRTGNRLLTGFFASVFKARLTDILSGYRVFSRRFVKSFPVLSRGFEIETELAVHALELDLPVAEIPTPYYARPPGSASKLSTWRDGLRILSTIVGLYRSERPLAFFSGIGAALAIVSIGLVDSDLRDLSARRHRAAHSHGDPVHRADAAGLSRDRCGSRARYGDAGTAGNEADRLSGAAGARRGLGPAASLRSSALPNTQATASRGKGAWRELVRTNDAVLVSAVQALLDAADIPHIVLDQNMSVLEGSIGILPRRILVNECCVEEARRLLEEAGLGHELRPDAPLT